MERIAGDVEGVHFGVADLDAVFIGSLVERASDLEARLCRRRADEFDDGDTIRQRPAAPVPRFAYCSGRPKLNPVRPKGPTPVAVMREPVEERGGHLGVAEHPRPLAEGEI